MINPFVLVTGTLAAPLVTGALGRTVLPKNKLDEEGLNKAIRNFALLNAVAALGLGLWSSRTKSDAIQSAALGGAVGTSIMAGVLGAGLLLMPKTAEAGQVKGGPTPVGALGTGTGNAFSSTPTWMREYAGY